MARPILPLALALARNTTSPEQLQEAINECSDTAESAAHIAEEGLKIRGVLGREDDLETKIDDMFESAAETFNKKIAIELFKEARKRLFLADGEFNTEATAQQIEAIAEGAFKFKTVKTMPKVTFDTVQEYDFAFQMLNSVLNQLFATEFLISRLSGDQNDLSITLPTKDYDRVVEAFFGKEANKSQDRYGS